MFFIFITCQFPLASLRALGLLAKAPLSVSRRLESLPPSVQVPNFRFIYFLCFIYNMLSSRICWSLRALGLLANADPLSASHRLESLPLFVQALNFSVYTIMYLLIYL